MRYENLPMKRFVLSILLLTSYAIALQIHRNDTDEIINVSLGQCVRIGGSNESHNYKCSQERSTLMSPIHDNNYRCRDISRLAEHGKYLFLHILILR